MCKMCAYHDIFCAGTSYAREFCRAIGAYTKEGQAPCKSFKEKAAPAATGTAEPKTANQNNQLNYITNGVKSQMFSSAITDREVDKFYGEYERPKIHRHKTLTCWNCAEDIMPGEEHTRLPDFDNDAPGAIICKECSTKRELLESVFNALSDSEKLEILGMEMVVYDG